MRRLIPMGLPVCTEVANEIVSLPMFPEMTREQVQRVALLTKRFLLRDKGFNHAV